ncbi:hypothetical protein PQ456_22070 [Paenibacillus kyungheensis]|uniref:CopG family transcriptional regulator n=1 Tax=Paenibacillus kyungheensis TaxID=1452732 RepID=A0AAX3M0P1_9BACL|nr:hypothetical protein [Paenibacillus kyungheensis]WCT55802.1 hypothetical protein PQ456_22070 [Paenibacillus kyungheensis]
MASTNILKPIRPTKISFENDKELSEFVEYATKKEKTHSDIMDNVRRDLSNHKRSSRRK